MRLALLLAVLGVGVLGTGYLNDHASCERHNELVPHVNAMAQYADDAALARERSAAHERFSDPAQAAIDRAAAASFRVEAPQIRSTLLDCGFPLPATR